MFSANNLQTPLSASIPAGLSSPSPTPTLGSAVSPNPLTIGLPTSASSASPGLIGSSPSPGLGGAVPIANVKEIVFIATDLPDYKNLVAGTRSDVKVVLLDPKQDGILQIGKVLSWFESLNAVHIVSYGNSGHLQLGTADFSLETFNQPNTNLTKWTKALAPGADVVLYGSNVGLGEVGSEFIQKLSQVTGADIAASTTPTGSEELGGDWNFEIDTGKISAQLAFQASVLQTYGAVFTSGLSQEAVKS